MKRSERIVFAVLLLAAVLPNLALVGWAEDFVSPGQRLLYLFATVVLYAIGLCFLHKRAYFYIISLGFVFSLLEVCHLIARHSSVTLLFLYTWFKTPPGEVLHAALPYLWLGPVVLVLWVLYYVLAHRFIERTYIAPLQWRIPALAVLLSVFILLPVRPAPLSVLHRLGRLAATAWQVEQNQPELRHFSYGIAPKTDAVQETVIVVTGETSYDEWCAAGYTDSLALFFDSVYTTCPVSGVSIPVLFTRATPQQQEPFFTERSVIKAFSEAGYYTAWLSNYGYHNHFLMRLADDCRYLFYRSGVPDTALLAPFREVMAQPATRHMVVLATQGAHDADYRTQIPVLLRQLTDSLSKVRQPAMMLYVGATNISLTDARSELHVPLVFWANPNYRYRHRAQLRQLYAQRHQRLSTEIVFHSLLYLNTIDCVMTDEQKAIGSPLLETADTIFYLDENLRATEYSFVRPPQP